MDNQNNQLLDDLQRIGLEALKSRLESGEATSGDLSVWRQLMKDNHRTLTPTTKGVLDDIMDDLGGVENVEVLYQ